MPLFRNIKVRLNEDLDEVLKKKYNDFESYRILKKSLDARRKNDIYYVYEIEIFYDKESIQEKTFFLNKVTTQKKVIIIGAGPAGIFSAMRLISRGIPCQILERGKPILERMRDISSYWKTGKMNQDSNVCFGEGGAGTFSDGKLITRIKSEYIPYIMDCFIKFGAPDDIRYLANPHIGSNKIRKVISQMTNWLSKQGCEICYNSTVSHFEFDKNKLVSVSTKEQKKYDADYFILATGHSAHDIYLKLLDSPISCESKSMAMGFRIEHNQKWVNKTQYGSFWEHPKLPVANYKLTYHNKKNDIGVYSFCMCPGGYVLASSAQEGHMVVNGMSNSGHNSPYANSGVVVTIDKNKWYPQGTKRALDFQSEIEKKTQQLVYKAGGTNQVPVQKVLDFLQNKKGKVAKGSCPSGTIAVNLRDIYPEEINTSIIEALHNFNRKMKGYLDNALLYGVESRTSSPIRIIRDKQELCSNEVNNFYPSGEGAGYAGGITSAAVDGIKIAEAIYDKIKTNN